MDWEAAIAPLEETALIGVDWGTSNVRAMRLAAGGRILEQRSDARGAGELAADAFAGVLDQIAGDWTADTPVLICGMAGSRAGWREAPYQPCPAGLSDLAQGLIRPDPDQDVFIVPGVSEMEGGALSDVMRGEETQMMGLWRGEGTGWAIAPGTHSKWVQVSKGCIASFRTFVTGELFAALQGSTLLAGAPAGARDDDAFRRGVERGLADRALSAALFSVRVDRLAGRLTAAAAPELLSGLLIGAEIAAQADILREQPVALVGATDLARRYALALDMAGFEAVETCDADEVTARGLWRIWEARA